MANTYRTFRDATRRLAEIDSILSGLVSPAFGFAHVHDNAIVTDIVSVNTPVKLAGNYTLDAASSLFDVVGNKLRYVGAEGIKVAIYGTLTLESSNNQVLGAYVALNNSVLHESLTRTTTSGSGKAENVSFEYAVDTLSQFDVIDFWIENTTGNADITCTALDLIVEQVGGR